MSRNPKMKKWLVKVPEVWIQVYEVFADTEQEAYDKTLTDGTLIEGNFEYSHVLPSESWDAEVIEITGDSSMDDVLWEMEKGGDIIIETFEVEK